MSSNTLGSNKMSINNYPIEATNELVFHSMPMSERKSSISPVAISTPAPKRKRGRPPKATSLSSQITTRLNIDVNTSPLSSSPTAESNSNLIVKQGAPDCFTPLMRVSQGTRRKKRKSVPSSNSPTFIKRQKNNESILATPLSSAINGSTFTPYNQINSKALDNISIITQSDSQTYHTPPSSTTKTHFPNSSNYVGTPTTFSSQTKDNVAKINDLTNPSFLMSKDLQKGGFSNSHSSSKLNAIADKSLLPAVSISSKSDIAPGKINEDEYNKISQCCKDQSLAECKSQYVDDSNNDFSLQLMIDESGKAVLSTNFFSSEPIKCIGVFPEEESIDQPNAKSGLKITANQKQFSTKSPFDYKDKQTHVNSIIGNEAQYMTTQQLDLPSSATSNTPINDMSTQIQSSSSSYLSLNQTLPLRRHNSEFSASSMPGNVNADLNSINETIKDISPLERSVQLPQTPKYKENYLYSTTGLTPSSNLTFNLTSQFNPMMYSTMNVNSPQTKKYNSSQFFMNQGLSLIGNQLPHQQTIPFQQHNTTINMTDLVNINGNLNSFNKIEKPIEGMTSSIPPSSSTSSNTLSHDDSGDARIALKKIIHVKRR